MFAFANNRIQRPDPKDEGVTEVIAAHTVFETNTEKFKELEALGAARKASSDEVTLYKDQQARLAGQTSAKVVENEDDDDDQTDDLSGRTVAELKGVAEAENIDLGDVTKKDDIAAKIRTERAARKAADDNILG
jgi:O6-methylguanine-DNA--protein-cysteine methyltransferase